jgi:hypothetical protein
VLDSFLSLLKVYDKGKPIIWFLWW